MNSIGGKSLFAGTPCSPGPGYSCGSAALSAAGAQEPPGSGAQEPAGSAARRAGKRSFRTASPRGFNPKGSTKGVALKHLTPGLGLGRAKELGSLSRGGRYLAPAHPLHARLGSAAPPRILRGRNQEHLPVSPGRSLSRGTGLSRLPRGRRKPPPARRRRAARPRWPGEVAAPPLRARREKAAGNPGLAAVQVISCFLRGSNSD